MNRNNDGDAAGGEAVTLKFLVCIRIHVTRGAQG